MSKVCSGSEQLFRCRKCPNVIVKLDEKKAHKAFHEMPKLKKEAIIQNWSKASTCRPKQFKNDVYSDDDEVPAVVLFEAVPIPTRHFKVQKTPQFMCEVCGKRFPRKGKLEIHMRSHTGEKPFICPLCAKGFTQKAHLLRHLTNIHSKSHMKNQHVLKKLRKSRMTNGNEIKSCCFCGMVFSISFVLRGHISTNHQEMLN